MLEIAENPQRESGLKTARVTAIVVAGVFSALVIRLYAVHVRPPEERLARVALQTQRPDRLCGTTLAEAPPRGRILDRTGRVLAESWFEHILVLDLAELVAGRSDRNLQYEMTVDAADFLSGALQQAGVREPEGGMRTLLLRSLTSGKNGKARQRVQIARGLDPRQRRVIREALVRTKLKGFNFEDSVRRSYPYGAVTSQVVGIVGESADDQAGKVAGRAGVERQMERVLDGSPGVFISEADADGREFLPRLAMQVPVHQGADVVLTIDAEIQRIVMDVLQATVKASEAKSASAVVLAAKSGEILAAATWPSVDPSSAPDLKSHADRLKLGAFVDLYEPGSTIKPLFVSWALQRNLVTASSMFDCGGPKGYDFFGPRKVTEYIANPRALSTESVIVKSSNVAAVRIGFERLGLSGMYDALEAFHFAWSPNIGYPIPVRCRYTPRNQAKGIWTGASFPQGYEMMTSPLGLARIFTVLGNGGELVEPALIKAVRTGSGTIERLAPERIRVLSKPVAESMLGFMEKVVEVGTAKTARSARHSMAGKTGTPKITGTNLYNPVFCAIAPVSARDPELIIVLQQNEVRGRGAGTYTGGAVSAPFVRDIVERVLQYLEVPAEPGRPEKGPAQP